MSDQKKEIRAKIIKIRRHMNNNERDFLSGRIRTNIVKFLEKRGVEEKSIHVFLPIQNEPDLRRLYGEWLKNGKDLFAPSVADDSKLLHYPFTNLDLVRQGALHTIEPIPENEPVEPVFDLILVPGVAFDTSGNRLGFGKGYYDKFLLEGTGLKIGIAYDFQVLDKIPVNEKDIPVDIIITDKKIYK